MKLIPKYQNKNNGKIERQDTQENYGYHLPEIRITQPFNLWEFYQDPLGYSERYRDAINWKNQGIRNRGDYAFDYEIQDIQHQLQSQEMVQFL